jgi:hypothetical protein
MFLNRHVPTPQLKYSLFQGPFPDLLFLSHGWGSLLLLLGGGYEKTFKSECRVVLGTLGSISTGLNRVRRTQICMWRFAVVWRLQKSYKVQNNKHLSYLYVSPDWSQSFTCKLLVETEIGQQQPSNP